MLVGFKIYFFFNAFVPILHVTKISGSRLLDIFRAT